MLRAMAEWLETWDDYSIEVRDAKDAGDKVLVSLHQRGRGKASGVQMEGDVGLVYTLQDGKIVRWQMFPDERDAVEAAGLNEQRA
jgi:ketosteroid isomerase-like protein